MLQYREINHCDTLHFLKEKAMAPHSGTLAWEIPWMEEPGRLQSMGSLRVGHDWATSLSLFTFMHWRRKWQTTPVFLPRESQGRGSLVGCRLWGHTELDTTEIQEKHLNKWSFIHVKNSIKIGLEGVYLNHQQPNIHDKATAKCMLKGENSKTFSKIRNSAMMPTLSVST